jgi:hypothetical protein
VAESVGSDELVVTASGAANYAPEIWETDGTLVTSLDGLHAAPITDVAFGAIDNMLASADSDGRIMLVTPLAGDWSSAITGGALSMGDQFRVITDFAGGVVTTAWRMGGVNISIVGRAIAADGDRSPTWAHYDHRGNLLANNPFYLEDDDSDLTVLAHIDSHPHDYARYGNTIVTTADQITYSKNEVSQVIGNLQVQRPASKQVMILRNTDGTIQVGGDPTCLSTTLDTSPLGTNLTNNVTQYAGPAGSQYQYMMYSVDSNDVGLWRWSVDTVSTVERCATFAADSDPYAIMTGHTDGVRGGMRLNSGMLLTWSDDGTLRLWNADGTAETTLDDHSDAVMHAIALDSNHGRILSRSNDGTLKIWRLNRYTGDNPAITPLLELGASDISCNDQAYVVQNGNDLKVRQEAGCETTTHSDLLDGVADPAIRMNFTLSITTPQDTATILKLVRNSLGLGANTSTGTVRYWINYAPFCASTVLSGQPKASAPAQTNNDPSTSCLLYDHWYPSSGADGAIPATVEVQRSLPVGTYALQVDIATRSTGTLNVQLPVNQIAVVLDSNNGVLTDRAHMPTSSGTVQPIPRFHLLTPALGEPAVGIRFGLNRLLAGRDDNDRVPGNGYYNGWWISNISVRDDG